MYIMPVDFLTAEQRQRYGRYPDDLTTDQQSRCFYLDDADQFLIQQCRTDATRLGFALQLCTVRFLGTFLDDPTEVPPVLVTLVAHQLGITDAQEHLASYRLNPVRWKHTAEIRHLSGYAVFGDQPGHFRLVRWLFLRAWYRNERPVTLFDRATAWLIERKILLPGATTLERLIAEVRERADTRLWRMLSRQVTPSQLARLETLVRVPDGERMTTLERLRRAPTRQSGQGLLTALRRLTEIRDLNVGQLSTSHIPQHRILTLYRFAATARAQTLARLADDRRIATLLAFVTTLEATAHDDVLDLLDAFITDVFARATRTGIQTRLRTMKDLDAAALLLATLGCLVLDETIADRDVRALALAAHPAEAIAAAVAQVADLTRPPDDTYYDELVAQSRRVGRIRPRLLSTISFAALPAGQAVLDAYRFLQEIEPKSRPALAAAPRAVITRTWQRYVYQGTEIDRLAYTFCVLDRLKDALRRRELYVVPSLRYADPRQGMIPLADWPQQRPHVCRLLGRSADAQTDLQALATQLDASYRATADRLPANTAVTLETRDGKPDLTLSPLDKLEEPASLLALRETLDTMLPQIDLPEVLLEIHRHTGFAHELTHLTEARARADDLPRSICAVLLAQACNVGMTPVADPTIPALTIDRLQWVAQNYVRAETLARANARLVEFQSQIGMVQAWGSGEVASVDGVRFVVPISTIKAGPGRKYFPNERGVTYLGLTADQYTELNGLVVTGTLRDSLVLVSLLLGQQTALQPHEIMTDMGSYADYIFGLLWLLGYQFSPRITDAGGARFWRIDREADYGALDDLARHPINLDLIAQHWDELLRLAGSLALGVYHIESLVRTLQRGDQPTRLARALIELGRIIKTLYLLAYIDDESYRRRILTQLNRGEGRNRLARIVFYGQRGELRQRYREGQEDQLGALGLVVNIIVLWNTLYLDKAITQLRAEGYPVRDEDVARISPLGHAHLNVLGRYTFELDQTIQPGALRPLRTTDLRSTC
jgi:TnpA family transposase